MLIWTTKVPSFLCALQTYSKEKAWKASSLEYSGAHIALYLENKGTRACIGKQFSS